MTKASVTVLRRLLLDRYDHLNGWLTRKLGSAETAHDALHDAWLRLANMEVIGPVQNPTNYLYRIIVNVARDRRAADHRYLSAIEVDRMLDLADDAPDPERLVETRSDLGALEAIMAELPPRRREILLAARLDNMPRQEIADRFGISLRLVSKELQAAHEYCLLRFRQRTGK
jgi:RNA polymerase sigma factor (sigma-70 family)